MKTTSDELRRQRIEAQIADLADLELTLRERQRSNDAKLTRVAEQLTELRQLLTKSEVPAV